MVKALMYHESGVIIFLLFFMLLAVVDLVTKLFQAQFTSVFCIGPSNIDSLSVE